MNCPYFFWLWARFAFVLAIVLTVSIPWNRAGQYDLTDAKTCQEDLPSRAVLRFGGDCWRVPSSTTALHFSADGKMLVCFGQGSRIAVLDASTGKRLKRFGLENAVLSTISDDGTLVAEIGVEGLHVWEVLTGKTSYSRALGQKLKLHELTGIRFVDNKHLAICQRPDVITIQNIDKNGDSSQSDLVAPMGNIRHFAISQNGKSIVLLHKDGQVTKWARVCGEYRLTPGGAKKLNGSDGAIALCPEGRRLLFWSRDRNLRLVELEELGELWSIGGVELPLGEPCCFSSHGNAVAIAPIGQQPQLIDVATGAVMFRVGEKCDTSSGLALHPKTNQIAQYCKGGIVRFWNLETGEGSGFPSGHRGKVIDLQVSPDGRQVTSLGLDNTARIWDGDTGKEIRSVALPQKAASASLIDSNRAFLQMQDGRLLVWDLAKQLTQVQVQRVKGANSTDHLVVRGGMNELHATESTGLATPGNLKIYSLVSGTEIADFTKRPIEHNDKQEWFAGQWRVTEIVQGSCSKSALLTATAPSEVGGVNGDSFFLGFKRSIGDAAFVWETRPVSGGEQVRALAISPDERTFLVYRCDSSKNESLSMLERWTGKERLRVSPTSKGASIWVHAFSKDGDLLAVTTGDDGAITVFDVRTNRELVTLTGQQCFVSRLTFGVNSATLYSAGANGTILKWNLAADVQRSRRPIPQSPDSMKRLWSELSSDDASAAYRAVGELVTSPAEAMTMLRGQFRPSIVPPRSKIDELVGELGSDTFRAREEAMKQLRQMGVHAQDALHSSRSDRTSLERFRRVEELLQELSHKERALSRDDLRSLRAIEVLDAIDTKESVAILDAIGAGTANPMVLWESKNAIRRRGKN